MFNINHNEAIELEHLVRRLYGCDRGGVSGMVDADYFDNKPIQAAVLVLSYWKQSKGEKMSCAWRRLIEQTLFHKICTSQMAKLCNCRRELIQQYVKEATT